MTKSIRETMPTGGEQCRKETIKYLDICLKRIDARLDQTVLGREGRKLLTQERQFVMGLITFWEECSLENKSNADKRESMN